LLSGCRVMRCCCCCCAGDLVVNKSMEYKARQNGVHGSL
jgi:hypothetical protein